MNIRINKCTSPSAWYADRIGQTLNVERLEINRHPSQGIPEDVYWCRTGDTYNTLNYVRASDATVILGASTCVKCEGCQHRNHAEAGGWCYMFAEAPEELPCSQHDKFEDARRKMGKHTRAVAFITGAFPSLPNVQAQRRPPLPDNRTI
jgi:hypothetical protein